jgi:hypothetical protein
MNKITETENMGLLTVVSAQPFIGIYAYTAEDFKNYIESLKIDGSPVGEWYKRHSEIKDRFLLTISLACGCIKNFKDLKDVPLKSIKCKHGNYFIKIGDDPDDNI